MATALPHTTWGGDYDTGGRTNAEIKELQKTLGVTADGIWGPETQSAYEKSVTPDQYGVTPSQYTQYGKATDQAIMSPEDYAKSVLNTAGYAQTSDPGLQAYYHDQNEQLRSGYDYSGGAGGDAYIKLLPTPGSYQAAEAPSFSSAYTQDVADLWDAVKNYGSFNYSNQNLYQQALDKVINREDFSYDAATDPLYSQYRKEYTREGDRAMEDTLGAAAAMSGGRASSWANTAAAQARNYYAAQMTDKIPELYQLALQKYLAEAQLDQSGLSAMQADRSAELGEWQGNYSVLADKANTARSLESTDYSRYLDELNQYNTDRAFEYNQLLDEIANQQKLEQQGYDRARTAELDALDKAMAGAGIGSYDQADALGFDTGYARAEQEANLAALQAQAAAAQAQQNLLDPANAFSNMQESGINGYETALMYFIGNGFSSTESDKLAQAYANWLWQQSLAAKYYGGELARGNPAMLTSEGFFNPASQYYLPGQTGAGAYGYNYSPNALGAGTYFGDAVMAGNDGAGGYAGGYSGGGSGAASSGGSAGGGSQTQSTSAGQRLAADTIASFGGTGVPDTAVAALVAAGVTPTELNNAATAAYNNGTLTLAQAQSVANAAQSAGIFK